MILVITYSARLTENFADLTTGTMAFAGIGDKSVELIGAFAAVSLGAVVGFTTAWFRDHRSHPYASQVPLPDSSFVPNPVVVLCAFLIATCTVTIGLRTTLAGLGVESGSWAWLGVALLWIGLLAWQARTRESSPPTGTTFIVIAQSVLGSGVFALLPAPDPHVGPAANAWTTPFAWLTAVVVTGVVCATGLHTLRSLRRGATLSAAELVNGPAVVVTVVALSATVLGPVIPRDGYHFGELVSPGYLAGVWGQMPYVDQFPARGLLVNYTPNWFADLMAAPGAGLVTLGHAWLSLALATLAYALAARHLPVTATLLVTLTTAFASANLIAIGDVAMVLGLVLVYRVSQWRHSLAWSFGTLFAVVAILAAPAQGVACLVAIIVLTVARLAAERNPRLRLTGIVAAACVAIIVVAVPPIRTALTSAMGYVASQGSVNDQVWGTPWLWSIQLQSQVSGATVILELVRAAVLPLLAVIGTLILGHLSRERLQAKALPLSLALFAYLVLQLPRALGRIDPDGISRIGALTLVAAGIALPFLACQGRWFHWTRATNMAAALVVVPLILLDGGIAKAATFTSRAMTTTDSTAGGRLVRMDGRFGGAMMDPALAAEYAALASQLHQLPGATDGLLDLTNNQADFRYLGAPNALSYGAAYNITSTSVETSELARLSLRPPRVSLLTTNLSEWHDGGSVGLRIPRIYRWILDHYVPIQCGTPGEPGFAIWGTSDGTAPSGCMRAGSLDERVEMFDLAFSPPLNLYALARSWGAPRANAISDVLVEPRPAATKTRQVGPRIDVHIPSPSPGEQDDVLTLDLNCGKWTNAVLTWYDPASPTPRFVYVDLGGGRTIVPMGSFPSFALRVVPLDVVAQVDAPKGCTAEAHATWSEHYVAP
ncbi:hypothetical protein [Terrabacter sp. Root85]|uniref:hypothetical protein n=1 Tax=Terrabacter sp. Root85 TaxID=1736603 RepID=UPI0012F72193|nr:hypothetical protein [Terrabacter sp. Root85]